MSDEPVGLADAIEGLRADLEAARLAGLGKAVRFDVTEVTVSLDVVASRDLEASGGVKWWVLSLGGKGLFGRKKTQTITLKLVPRHHDGPLHVTGSQSEPGD